MPCGVDWKGLPGDQGGAGSKGPFHVQDLDPSVKSWGDGPRVEEGMWIGIGGERVAGMQSARKFPNTIGRVALSQQLVGLKQFQAVPTISLHRTSRTKAIIAIVGTGEHGCLDSHSLHDLAVPHILWWSCFKGFHTRIAPGVDGVDVVHVLDFVSRHWIVSWMVHDPALVGRLFKEDW